MVASTWKSIEFSLHAKLRNPSLKSIGNTSISIRITTGLHDVALQDLNLNIAESGSRKKVKDIHITAMV